METILEDILDKPKAILFLGIFLGACLFVIMAIMLDLWDGVYTARKTGVRIHSHKLRITISKISEYFRFLAIAFLVDCIGFLFSFYFMPFVLLVFGTGLICTEARSMFEHSRLRKSHTAELPDIARQMVNCHNMEDALKIIGIITDAHDKNKDRYSKKENERESQETKDTLHEMPQMFDATFIH